MDSILVVEDEHDVGLAIRTVLSRAGYDVHVETTGLGGVAEFRTSRPDAVVLDVGLPDLDGWGVLERIREFSTRPVLLLTAHGTDSDKVRGLRAGADDYLTKPFSNPELTARVNALIRRSRAVPDDDPSVAERVDELRAALASEQIVPFYQPIVALNRQLTVGAEALARWLHPELGLVPPDDFIGLAEQSGLVAELGTQILRRACADAAGWPVGASGPRKVTVNVSGLQLVQDDYANLVRSALDDSGLPAAQLVLEVTESTVGGDDPQARAALASLRRLGVRVAIDDFGTGTSNLSRLASLPVDVVKLDRSFLRGFAPGSRAQALIRGLVSLAHELDLSVVVEGVEKSEESDLLQDLGADEGQGWLWGRAVPGEEFERRVS